MKYLLSLAICVILATPAGATTRRHVSQFHFGRYLAARHFHHRHHARVSNAHANLPGPCRVAASMGGPCGCWAEHVLLGRLEHVLRDALGAWNPWLADDWLRFRHVPVADAIAVVWPGRHVAPTVPGTYSNGTIMVRDSWATHRVRVAGLIGVDPRPADARRGPRVAGAWPL